MPAGTVLRTRGGHGAMGAGPSRHDAAAPDPLLPATRPPAAVLRTDPRAAGAPPRLDGRTLAPLAFRSIAARLRGSGKKAAARAVPEEHRHRSHPQHGICSRGRVQVLAIVWSLRRGGTGPDPALPVSRRRSRTAAGGKTGFRLYRVPPGQRGAWRLIRTQFGIFSKIFPDLARKPNTVFASFVG